MTAGRPESVHDLCKVALHAEILWGAMQTTDTTAIIGDGEGYVPWGGPVDPVQQPWDGTWDPMLQLRLDTVRDVWTVLHAELGATLGDVTLAGLRIPVLALEDAGGRWGLLWPSPEDLGRPSPECYPDNPFASASTLELLFEVAGPPIQTLSRDWIAALGLGHMHT